MQLQGVSGQITAATGGAPLPGAFVLLADMTGQSFAAVLTDASGNYSFNSPTGTFSVFAVRTGFVADFAAGGVMVVASQFATKNLALASGGFTISGKLSDNISGAGIAGVFVLGESTNNLFSGGLTDANGNYIFSVTASQWKIQSEGAQLAQAGYVRAQDVTTNTTASGSATINFAVSKATALIYGTVKDNLNNPVNGLGVQANDQGNLYKAEGVTFSPNANYSVGVLAGTWNVGPDSDSLVARGFTGGSGSNVTVSAGQAVPANFVVQGVTAHLRGQVLDDSGVPIPNIAIVVQPFPIQPNGSGSIYPMTDSNGNFDAGVRGGTWNIALECVQAQARGYVNVADVNFTVTDNVDQNGIVLTFPRSTFVITGTVKDNLNNPIAGVELDAGATVGNIRYFPGCVATDSGGNYTIKVINGSWNVNVRSDDLNARGYTGVSGQTINISGANGVANFVVAAYANTRPTLSQPAYFGPGQFFLQSTGEAGRNYALEFSTTLTNWTPLSTNYFNSAANNTLADPSAPGTFRFYRLRLVP